MTDRKPGETRGTPIDNLFKDWAQTSEHHKSLEGYLIGSVNLSPPGGMSAEHYRNVVGVLEAFNGARFYSPIGGRMPAGQTGRVLPDGAWSYSIVPPQAQVNLLMQAYGALRDGVYEALVMQTRMKPYLDAIELAIDENGIRFDASGMHALLNQRYASAPQHAWTNDPSTSEPQNGSLKTTVAQRQVQAICATQTAVCDDAYVGDAAGNCARYGICICDVLMDRAGNDAQWRVCA